MKNLKVFIVDDDPDFAEGIALSLELEGHEVTFASSGEAAVNKFRDIQFDVTLMDVRMPGMNGVETLRKILDIRPDAKVIMITAYRVEELMSQALADGALGVLQKPVSSQKLIEAFKDIHAAGVVLLADDDPDFAAAIESVLISEGYVVFKARNGQEAIDKVMDEDIDVLLLDIRMPDLSGLEVYTELKKRGRVPPTIVATGYLEEESEAIQELLGTSERTCLVKPISSEKLLQAIDATI